MDFSIILSKKQLLRGMINSPGDNARAGVILVHGVGEHSGRYSHWVKKFSEKGIAFVAVDLPGHGRSDGKRGHIKSYSKTARMLDILIGEYRKTFPGVPVFLYGHSLGGGIVLDYLIKTKPRVKGAVITSPWLKLPYEPARYKIVLAGLMKRIYPSLTQSSGLVVDLLSQDTDVVDKYKNDPLVHDRISAGLFYSAISAAKNALDRAQEIKVPLLLMHGSVDQICSPEGSREFTSKNDNAKLKIWEGGFHELHNEPFKDDVFAYITSWMNNFI